MNSFIVQARAVIVDARNPESLIVIGLQNAEREKCSIMLHQTTAYIRSVSFLLAGWSGRKGVMVTLILFAQLVRIWLILTSV